MDSPGAESDIERTGSRMSSPDSKSDIEIMNYKRKSPDSHSDMDAMNFKTSLPDLDQDIKLLESIELHLKKEENVEASPEKILPLQNRIHLSKHDQAFLCVVCNDRASGYHYGVPACEGCKAFFKRSLQSKDLNYKCPASSNCTIDKLSRKCCQACRLKKCYNVGMSKEFLGNKIKRPKIAKEKYAKSHQRKHDSGSRGSPFEITFTTDEEELENTIRRLTVVHSKLYLRLETFDRSCTLMEKLCRIIDLQLVRIIDWAKQLPGYCNLAISDQAILLQAAWVDLLVLNWLYHSSKVENALCVSRGLAIGFNEALELGFENIYVNLLSLAARARKYIIEEEEISCLKAISLTNAESTNLSGPDMVNDLTTLYSAALQYCTVNHRHPSPQKFAKLVLLLPQLKCIVSQVIDFLYTTKVKSSKRTLSDLVMEMLEAKLRL